MGRKRTKSPMEGIEADDAAKKRAWTLMQVLSGQMGVTEAAKAAQITVNRYYQLEKKALSAMLLALSPEAGRGKTLQSFQKLEKKSACLEQENARQRQLLRMARRLWGPLAGGETRKGKSATESVQMAGATS